MFIDELQLKEGGCVYLYDEIPKGSNGFNRKKLANFNFLKFFQKFMSLDTLEHQLKLISQFSWDFQHFALFCLLG